MELDGSITKERTTSQRVQSCSPRIRLVNLIRYSSRTRSQNAHSAERLHCARRQGLEQSVWNWGLRHCLMDEYPDPFCSVFYSRQQQFFHPPSHPLLWGLCCLLPLFQLLVHSLLRGHGTAPLWHVHETTSLEDLLFLTTRVRVVLHVVIVRLGRPFVCETSYLRIRYCFPNNTTLCKRHYQRQGRVAKRHYPFHEFH